MSRCSNFFFILAIYSSLNGGYCCDNFSFYFCCFIVFSNPYADIYSVDRQSGLKNVGTNFYKLRWWAVDGAQIKKRRPELMDLKHYITCRLRGCHSSVNSSAPTILQSEGSNPKHTLYAFK